MSPWVKRRRAKADLRAAEERFRRVFEDSSVGMAVVGIHGDDEHRILEANQALARLLGQPLDELIGSISLPRVVGEEATRRAQQRMRALAAGEIDVYQDELELHVAGGGTVFVDVTTSILHDAKGRPAYRLSQVVDVTDRKRVELHLRHLADHDTLSGLLNRRRFEEEVAHEVRRAGGRGAVCVLDVDNFKQVNDTLGHAAGDEVIRRVADALRARLRTGDVLGRIGGDEFGILLRRVGAFESAEVGRSIVKAVEHAMNAGTSGPQLGISMGIAPFEGTPDTDSEELLQAADAAMYDAKSLGGGLAIVAQTRSAAA